MAAPVAQNMSADFSVNGCDDFVRRGDGSYHGGRYARRCGSGLWLVGLFVPERRVRGRKGGFAVGV
jgi:hypothetical protein